MNRPILFLLSLLFVASCTEQSDVPPHQAKQPEVQHNSPTRTPQEAQNEVADFLAAMGKKTRSATRPTIANVETLRSRQFATRAAVDSLSIDTLLYFVNFADNQGFAVVAADKRTSPVLALIDKGNYKAGDLAQEANPGFLSFLDRAINQEIEHTTRAPRQAIGDFNYNGWEIFDFLPPLLKVKWGQEHPYNIFCPGYKDMKHAHTGCTVTAMAQICSYYKYPYRLSWNSYGTWVTWSYNWERILQDCSKTNGNITFDEDTNREYVLTAGEVASLMNYLGIAFHAKYEKATSVSGDTPIEWVRDNGWFNVSKPKKYDEQTVIRALNNSHVIYTTGLDTKRKTWLFFNKYEGGHAWVIDGYIRAMKGGYSHQFVHCNWGWNGNGNGFFYSNVFNASQDPIIDDYIKKPTKETRSNTPYYFQYDVKISVIYPAPHRL